MSGLPYRHVISEISAVVALPRRPLEKRPDLQRGDDDRGGDGREDEGGLAEARGQRRPLGVPGDLGVPERVGAERQRGVHNHSLDSFCLISELFELCDSVISIHFHTLLSIHYY